MINPQQIMLINNFFAFTAVLTALGCGTGIIVTWINRKERKQLESPALMNRLGDLSDRLSRLDASIDTIAVEVERISEAQRFTARVLAERSSPGALPEAIKPLGSRTPH